MDAYDVMVIGGGPAGYVAAIDQDGVVGTDLVQHGGGGVTGQAQFGQQEPPAANPGAGGRVHRPLRHLRLHLGDAAGTVQVQLREREAVAHEVDMRFGEARRENQVAVVLHRRPRREHPQFLAAPHREDAPAADQHGLGLRLLRVQGEGPGTQDGQVYREGHAPQSSPASGV